MPSKSIWGVIVATLFAILAWVLPVPEKWRTVLIVVTAVLLLLACAGWLVAHFRESRPKLIADVICLTIQGTRKTDNAWACFLTMSVNVKNTGTDTTILDFDCEVTYRDRNFFSRRVYGLGRFRQFVGYEPTDDPSQVGRIRAYARLYDFPEDAPVTKSKNTRGWLRFRFSSLPAGAMRTDTGFNNNVSLKLFARDGLDNKLHLIYQGPEPNSSCGAIEEIPPTQQ